jgi:hypothetical protein
VSKHPGEIQKANLYHSLIDLLGNKLIEGTHIIVASVQTQIDGEKIGLTQYVTGLDQNQIDPIAYMKQNAKVWIIQPSYDLLPILKYDIVKVFCKALQSQDEETLIPLVGEFCFKFAFAYPYERGSATIGEWFEQAIYLSKNYELALQGRKFTLLKAWQSPSLPLFLEKYPSYTNLKKL